MIKKWEAQEMTMSYHQFTVYQKGGKPPVMDWTDEDIKRGFTTGEHAVSFEALENTASSVEVRLNVQKQVLSFNRRVTVPFEVLYDGVEIASVLSKKLTCDIPQGAYQLTCYTIMPDHSGTAQITYLLDFKQA
ncbi:competence protein ComJ [Bacillus licheniformis]|uniref:competence protein ComJ n=1 Tax=Bacillus licheniformis TaxID=1402 RepID=UPI002DB75271|nr:competence protein ComJ [Bacillus licheniformis]MEC1368461.1 competence protein ComJ [Bacillus licheniformis]MEC1465914.1 competence protein ComJ [Bacillus licheniformis]